MLANLFRGESSGGTTAHREGGFAYGRVRGDHNFEFSLRLEGGAGGILSNTGILVAQGNERWALLSGAAMCSLVHVICMLVATRHAHKNRTFLHNLVLYVVHPILALANSPRPPASAKTRDHNFEFSLRLEGGAGGILSNTGILVAQGNERWALLLLSGAAMCSLVHVICMLVATRGHTQG